MKKLRTTIITYRLFSPKALLLLVVFVLFAISGYADNPNDSITLHNEGITLHKQQRQYENWKAKAERHKWSADLFNLLFDAPRDTKLSPMEEKSSYSLYGCYEGRVIKRINVKVFKPFCVKERERNFIDSCDNIFEKVGNVLHTNTKGKHIRNFLTIVEGDLLDVKLLEDNETRIRALSYIDEVFFNIIDNVDGTVDINIIVKDRFEWEVSHQAYNLDSHKVKLYNKNLWGIGHSIGSIYRYAPQKHIKHNYYFKYGIPSLPKSKISAYFTYENTYLRKKYEIDLYREFLDYRYKYAGGIRFNRTMDAEGLPVVSVFNYPNNINFVEYDAWIGRTIPFDLEKRYKYARYRKAIVLRAYRLHFTKYPEKLLDGDEFMLNTTGFLASYNVSRRRMYRSNLMYGYGRIEDIPSGYLAQLLGGVILNKDSQYNYVGLNLEKTRYNIRSNDYFGLRLSGGTLFNEGGFLEGLINTEIKYISKLFPCSRSQVRHFFKLRYQMGLNTDNDFINLTGSQGIHNMKTKYANGTRKYVFNMENVFFTPYTLAGFRIACYTFADVGLVGSNCIKNDRIYAGIGMGLRFRNNSFIFRTFQLNFTLFLKPPADIRYFVPDASGVNSEKFRDLRIRKPRFFFERNQY